MIYYHLDHIKSFGESWSNLKIQWETVHLPPRRKDVAGGMVFLTLEWLEYIRAMNTPEAFKWMIGANGTMIWGIHDKKHLNNKINKPKMPLIAIGGNTLLISDVHDGYGKVWGLPGIDYTVTPETCPEFWHRIWCVTKLRKAVSEPHDTPRGPAYLPIISPANIRCNKTLAGGEIFVKVVGV
jgi:hypothetical protein